MLIKLHDSKEERTIFRMLSSKKLSENNDQTVVSVTYELHFAYFLHLDPRSFYIKINFHVFSFYLAISN